MKCIIVGLAVLFAFANAGPSDRQKRFAGFGAFSTVGGRVGCVVSENSPGNASLYVNSHFTKYLSEEELSELSQYKDNLAKFKQDVKVFLEQRQQQALANRGRSGFGGRGGPEPRDQASSDADKNRSVQPLGKQPEPPKKPSFCSDKATTQYVFDGCSVQADSVYIGDNFVRKLTSDEQEELAQFDKQFTAYQKAVTTNFRQQVEDIFGKHFGQLFDAGSGSKSGEVPAVEPSNEAVRDSGVSTPSAPLEAPKTPNFCTLIV
ncbi:pepsin inhibitor-3-like repeated domain-containing protein [Ditylenchus destructor]|uniref:Pepsin inhibitor-3-like repeated domain-containing protein n=1 Tax=Ditylenchus destructor TaxID=166010 RepID=A0AAD4NC74_9BILA|nr:pepsin inhibitor-3-like repeated domain-containing protein [Ditylenchus destructor]